MTARTLSSREIAVAQEAWWQADSQVDSGLGAPEVAAPHV
jgi:hypothetical protein